MAKDKYSAVWVSHSSISDWLSCPRAYFLKNIYKNPQSGRKISLIHPAMTLGQAVHEVIEALSVMSVERRFEKPLLERLETVWKKVSGKRGGFLSQEEEGRYKQRAREMLQRIEKNPGPLKNLAVKIQLELPYFWLSEKDNIILCGKIDWLEYLKEENSVHIIDFKTGKNEEKADSLQLPIYYLVASHTQKRPVAKLSYWYINRRSEPQEQKLKRLDQAEKKILKIAKEIKLARQINRFNCPHRGCRVCQPLEKLIQGEAELVATDGMGREVYILPQTEELTSASEIL